MRRIFTLLILLILASTGEKSSSVARTHNLGGMERHATSQACFTKLPSGRSLQVMTWSTSASILNYGVVAQKAAKTRKPNIVFILVDDMGYGDIGPFGVTDTQTPNIDQLAREGVKFTNNYSNGAVCTPTRAALITGRYQQRVGMETAILANQHNVGLSAKEPSIARMLKEKGYATAVFGKWHLGDKPEFGPNAHGFDEFFGLLGGNIDYYAHKRPTGDPDLWENREPVVRDGYMTDLITERSVEYIEKHEKQPFFLYVAYNGVHWPYQAPNRPDDIRTRKTWQNGDRSDYVKMVESVDSGIGAILQTLEKRGLAKDTLVIFTDDNGGERLSRNAPLTGEKGSLWEGGIRVPAIMRWPGKLKAGSVSEQPVITMDFSATILAVTGAKPPVTQPVDGLNILPNLQGKKLLNNRPLFWRIKNKDQRAVRRGNWKYLHVNGKDQLFDLSKDISEKNDVSAKYPKTIEELRSLYDAWEKRVVQTSGTGEVKEAQGSRR